MARAVDVASIYIDHSDVSRLAKRFRALPQDMQSRVINSAMTRVSSQIGTRIVRFTAKRIKVPQKLVRQATTTRFDPAQGAIVVRVSTAQIPLIDIGARQTKRGVSVRGRGSVASGFITTVRTAGHVSQGRQHGGHRGVFKRESSSRLPIQEKFGPNPAGSIIRAEPEYMAEAVENIEALILPRVMHELNRALGQMARG